MRPISFEGQTLVMGAPTGTPPNRCGSLPTRVGQSDIWPGARTFTSYFKPSEAELGVLNAGGCVEVQIHADRHPPVAINTGYPKEVA